MKTKQPKHSSTIKSNKANLLLKARRFANKSMNSITSNEFNEVWRLKLAGYLYVDVDSNLIKMI